MDFFPVVHGWHNRNETLNDREILYVRSDNITLSPQLYFHVKSWINFRTERRRLPHYTPFLVFSLALANSLLGGLSRNLCYREVLATSRNSSFLSGLSDPMIKRLVRSFVKTASFTHVSIRSDINCEMRMIVCIQKRSSNQKLFITQSAIASIGLKAWITKK